MTIIVPVVANFDTNFKMTKQRTHRAIGECFLEKKSDNPMTILGLAVMTWNKTLKLQILRI